MIPQPDPPSARQNDKDDGAALLPGDPISKVKTEALPNTGIPRIPNVWENAAVAAGRRSEQTTEQKAAKLKAVADWFTDCKNLNLEKLPTGLIEALRDGATALRSLSRIGSGSPSLSEASTDSAQERSAITAVNGHADLVEALKDLWLWASEQRTHLDTDPVPDGLGVQVLAALAKAGQP